MSFFPRSHYQNRRRRSVILPLFLRRKPRRDRRVTEFVVHTFSPFRALLNKANKNMVLCAFSLSDNGEYSYGNRNNALVLKNDKKRAVFVHQPKMYVFSYYSEYTMVLHYILVGVAC